MLNIRNGKETGNLNGIFGFILCVLAVFCAFFNVFLFFFLLLVGCVVGIGSTGFLIDFKSKKYKKYLSIFFFYKGRWKSLENFKYLSIISRNLKGAIHGRGGASVTFKEIIYELYLLDETHTRRILIEKNDDLKSISMKASEISILFNYEIVEYSPEISEQNKLRRLKRESR